MCRFWPFSQLGKIFSICLAKGRFLRAHEALESKDTAFMFGFFKSMIRSTEYSLKDIAHERASCPMLICHRIGYGYMNNDWTMVISNLVILVFTACVLVVSMASHKPISG